MPLIKVDYSQDIFDKETIEELVQLLLKESMRIYDYGEDKISIFTAPYGEHFFSTAATEIELRAKLAEYQKPDISKDDLRQQHMKEYQEFLQTFVQKHQLPKGIVFTITFEDWQVVWLPGANEE